MKNALRLFSSLIAFSFLVSACSHTSPKVLNPKLFPDGKYNQSIQLEIKPPKGKGMFIPFTSLSQINKGAYKILGLTPFGTKAFEAQGNINKPGSIAVKFHTKLPKALSMEFIKSTISQIQSLQNLKRSQLTKKSNYDSFVDNETELKIFKYTKNGIPSSLVLKNPNWKAFIETSSFKPL